MRYRARHRMSDLRYRRACQCRPAPQRAGPAVNPERAAAEARLDAMEAAWATARAAPAAGPTA